jgi:DNA-binding response OmpR family regulator
MAILIVHDDPSVLELLAFAFRREGYETLTTYNAQRAFNVWQAQDPELVIIDGDLPEHSGQDLCRQIRQAGDTPIMLLGTGKSDAEIVSAYELGADDYVLQPFGPRVLLVRAWAILRRAQRSVAPAGFRALKA